MPSLPFSKEKEDEVVEAPAAPIEMQLPIGTIHHVDPEAGFALIQTSRVSDIDPGTKITAYGNGGVISAVLTSGEARRGQFVTADIIEGMPARGEQCTMVYTPPQATGASEGLDAGGDEIQVLE